MPMQQEQLPVFTTPTSSDDFSDRRFLINCDFLFFGTFSSDENMSLRNSF